MDGMTIDDLISGSRTSSFTEEDVVTYVRAGDPTHQDWDEWPLRMTYRINRFLLAHRDNPEPDLAILGTHLLFKTHTVRVDSMRRLRLICLGCYFF